MKGVEVLMLVALIVGAAACAMSASLTGYTFDLTDGRIYNPQAEAQATRVALLAADEARARSIEMDAAQVETDAVEDAKAALVARNVMVAMAMGVGALVLVIGGAFVVLAWMGKRATAIYPNAAGQYPVIVRRGFGWITFHDPNRGLGPAAVYKVPTLLDQVAAVALAIAERRAPQLPAPAADFPATAQEGTMAQIATQAQAGQVAAAQNKWPKSPLWLGRLTQGGRGGDEPPVVIEPAARMPQITVVNNPQEVAEFREKLLLEAEGQ